MKINSKLRKAKPEKTPILVTEQQLAKAWDQFVHTRSGKIINDSKQSAALKLFIKKLRYFNEV